MKNYIKFEKEDYFLCDNVTITIKDKYCYVEKIIVFKYVDEENILYKCKIVGTILYEEHIKYQIYFSTDKDIEKKDYLIIRCYEKGKKIIIKGKIQEYRFSFKERRYNYVVEGYLLD